MQKAGVRIFSYFAALSQDENTMGRFLKNESQRDKTRAGKMMAAVGKTQSHASQQRSWNLFSKTRPQLKTSQN